MTSTKEKEIPITACIRHNNKTTVYLESLELIHNTQGLSVFVITLLAYCFTFHICKVWGHYVHDILMHSQKSEHLTSTTMLFLIPNQNSNIYEGEMFTEVVLYHNIMHWMGIRIFVKKNFLFLFTWDWEEF